MDFKKTFISLIILGGLLFYVSIIDNNRDKSSDKELKKFINDFDISTIDYIQVDKKDESYTMKKIDNKWIMFSPDSFEVNITYPENFITKLAKIHILEQLDKLDTKIKEIGLNENKLTYTLKNKKNSLKFSVGYLSSNQKGIYAQFNNKFFIIERGLNNFGRKSSKDLRQKYIFDIDSGNINKFVVTKYNSDTSEDILKANKNKEGIWFIDFGGRDVRANRLKLEDIIVGLINMEVSSFDRNAENQGVKRKELSIAITIMCKGKEYDIDFGDLSDENKIKGFYPNRGITFYCKKKDIDSLFTPREKLRAPSILDLNIYNVSNLKISIPGTTPINLLKRSGNWNYFKANKRLGWTNSDSVETLLLNTVIMPIKDYIDPPLNDKILENFKKDTIKIETKIVNRDSNEILLIPKDYKNNPLIYIPNIEQIYRVSPKDIEKIVKEIYEILKISIGRTSDM